MSSPNCSTSNIEDAFSSMNILNYTSASPDYFPASVGSSSFNSSENPKENMIPPVFSSFYNNPCLKGPQYIISMTKENYYFTNRSLLLHQLFLTLSPRMPPKRMSTSETPAITLATIQQLITNGISLALKEQAGKNGNAIILTGTRNLTGTPVAKTGKQLKSLLVLNLSTSMVRKELLTSFAGFETD
ncbi:hypothetical protein Tco_1347456 [Tanacetum coccineum]